MSRIASEIPTASISWTGRLWAALLVLAAGQAASLGEGPPVSADSFAAAPAIGEIHPVAARLIADRKTIAPGGRLRIGVLLEMPSSWHVYWKNPGDAGLATEVQWKLPKGFVAGPLQWPVPVRFDQEGGIAGYGYAGQVLHWAEISVPENLPLGKPVRLAVEVDWLACKGQCLPGRAGLDITLGVAAQPRPDHTALFDAWQQRLPARPGAASKPAVRAAAPGKITTAWSALTFEITWPGTAPAKLEWFPPAADELEFGPPAFASAAGKTQVRLPVRLLAGNALPARTLAALVAWTDTGRRRGLTIPIRLRPARAKPAGAPPVAVRAGPCGARPSFMEP